MDGVFFILDSTVDASVIEMCIQELRTPPPLSFAVEHSQAQVRSSGLPLIFIMGFVAWRAKQQILRRYNHKKNLEMS